MLKAERVVEESLDALSRNKMIIVPGSMGQGLVAGLNAALAVTDRDPLGLREDALNRLGFQAYLELIVERTRDRLSAEFSTQAQGAMATAEAMMAGREHVVPSASVLELAACVRSQNCR